MFRRKKDKEIDIGSLNDILSISKKLINIVYIMTIIALILLGTYLVKEWHALRFLGEFLIVISPIFIGLIIAWLLDPLVKWLQGKKVPRIFACIIVYLLFLALLFLILALLVPAMGSQIKDFVSGLPAFSTFCK